MLKKTVKLFEVCERRTDLQTFWVLAESVEAFEQGDYEQTDRLYVEECEDLETVYIKEIIDES